MSNSKTLTKVVRTLTIDPKEPILPKWADAAIYFVEAEYVFAARTQGKEGSQFVSKFLRPVDVAAAFTHHENDTGWIKAGIVRMGNSMRGPWFIHHAGARTVEIQFDKDPKKYRIPIPPTVLVGVGNSYYIFATKDDKSLTGGTAIYCAPFPNVYGDGRICWGSNRPPKNEDPIAGEKAWSLFFGSPFNEHLDTGHIASDRKLLDFLKGLDGHRKFPVAMLKQHGYDLRSVNGVLKAVVHSKESDGE